MKHAVGDDARNTRSSSLALPILGVAIVRSNYAARGPSHPGPRATKRRSLRFPMLNSARRPGIVRLHFRARRFCRRCAPDASYESVGNAGSIDVTTTDISLVIDSVQRCKG